MAVCEVYITFSLVMTTLFKEAKRSTQIGFLILLISLIPYQIVITISDKPWVFWLLCWTPGTAPLLYIYEIVSDEGGWSGNRNLIAIPTVLGPIIYFVLFLYLDQIFTHFKSPLYLCRNRLELGADDASSDLVLKVEGIVKRYSGLEVLKRVSF